MSDDVELLKRMYDLFNSRDIERVSPPCIPTSFGQMEWKMATSTDATRCAAIGNVNGRSSIRMSSPSRSRPMARGKSLSKFIRWCVTQRPISGRQNGDPRLPDTKWAHPAFRYPRCIVGCQNRIMQPCLYVRSGCRQTRSYPETLGPYRDCPEAETRGCTTPVVGAVSIGS
jgi:hypothetical protein